MHFKLIPVILSSMGNFDRNRSSRPSGPARYASRSDAGGGRGFERRGPVEMHQAVCDKCRQNCEVPFRPTSGKPIFCSSCFESNRGSESPRPSYGREDRNGDRQMFDATCDECKNRCQVPFQPSGGKPVYCSDCFGDKKNAGGDRNNGSSKCQCSEQCEALNNKLDRILALLIPNAVDLVEEVKEEAIEVVEPKKAKAKKSPAKKK